MNRGDRTTELRFGAAREGDADLAWFCHDKVSTIRNVNLNPCDGWAWVTICVERNP
jgi:hypothetical protein